MCTSAWYFPFHLPVRWLVLQLADKFFACVIELKCSCGVVGGAPCLSRQPLLPSLEPHPQSSTMSGARPHADV